MFTVAVHVRSRLREGTELYRGSGLPIPLKRGETRGSFASGLVLLFDCVSLQLMVEFSRVNETRPGTFRLGSRLPCKRAALWGVNSSSCCMSRGNASYNTRRSALSLAHEGGAEERAPERACACTSRSSCFSTAVKASTISTSDMWAKNVRTSALARAALREGNEKAFHKGRFRQTAGAVSCNNAGPYTKSTCHSP